MKKKFLMITTSLAMAAVLAGCNSSAQEGRVEDYIGVEAAKSAALSASQVSSTGATFSAAELSECNGIPYYEVDFTANGLEYRYAIDAQTGTVIDSSSTAATTTQQTTTANSGTATTTTGAIDEARAKQIALADAGVSESDTAFLWAKLDWDDGAQVYDVEFYVPSTSSEYDYEIDANTGTIRSKDYDAENYNPNTNSATSGNTTGAASSSVKSEDEIRQIALAKVPGATANDIRLHLDRDDGRLRYEGTIIYQGMEYEFEIDAYSGAIREWDAESVYDD